VSTLLIVASPESRNNPQSSCSVYWQGRLESTGAESFCANLRDV
jgi:hypothetical protein